MTPPGPGGAVVVDVFADGPGGGNPAPIVIDAAALTDAQMQDVARRSGHESGFVLPAPAGSDCDLALRFWVPGHEMSMCGHATVGAVWLLHRLGRVAGEVRIATPSGVVRARVRDDGGVEVSQPVGTLTAVPADGAATVCDVLGVDGGAVVNAATSRVKTLVAVPDEAALDGLSPDLARIEATCTAVGSSGLYPYAPVDPAAQLWAARQFPRSSGYPEDAATGIAAAALTFGLLDRGLVDAAGPVRIRQGRAMGRPSLITVRVDVGTHGRPTGCWLGGPVRLAG